jgi:hypothetical protein
MRLSFVRLEGSGSMNTELEEIRRGLQRLQSLPIEQVQQLSLSHKRDRYHLNPPLSEQTVLQFEKEHKIQLPHDYRAFLIQLGNGGAGPAYGVFKLGEAVIAWDSQPFDEIESFVGDLSVPFPHAGPWNDHSDDAVYLGPIDGAVPVCDIGCGSRFWLVVTGPESGNIWCDQRADYAGLTPMAGNGTPRLSFLHWYLNWLRKELARNEPKL